jgi:hypothetical protein
MQLMQLAQHPRNVLLWRKSINSTSLLPHNMHSCSPSHTRSHESNQLVPIHPHMQAPYPTLVRLNLNNAYYNGPLINLTHSGGCLSVCLSDFLWDVS